MISAQDELERFLDRRAAIFAQAFFNLARAGFQGGNALQVALQDLAHLIQKTLILSDLHGRRRVLMEADKIRRARFAQLPDKTPLSSIPFEEAIEDLLEREPRLAESAQEVQQLYNTQKVFAMARSANLELTKRVQKAVTDLVAQGKSPSDTEAVIAEIGDWTRAYSATVYRTNVNTSYTNGRFAQAADPDVAAVIPAMEFVAQNDARTRPNHAAAHGLIAGTDDPIWSRIAPPLGFQCVTEDTKVCGQVVGASKAVYSGPVVELKTRNGRTLTVTINHPVFTRRGWVLAGDLTEGDDLVCHGNEIKSFTARPRNGTFSFVLEGRRTIDGKEVPSLIKDIFDALWAKRMGAVRSRVPVFPLDFNGDAKWMNGDIDVVRADSLFKNDAFHSEVKVGEQFGLQLGIGSSESFDALRGANFVSKGSFNTPDGTPSVPALSFNDTPVISTLLSESPLQFLSFGLVPDVDVMSNEESRYSSSVDPEFLRQLEDAGPVFVEFDRISEVSVRKFSGHVYDLETKGGWIIANGIYISNCRCAPLFVSVFELERRGLLKNGKVTPYFPPGFNAAHPDPGFNVRRFSF